jgi:hypothetical protein
LDQTRFSPDPLHRIAELLAQWKHSLPSGEIAPIAER